MTNAIALLELLTEEFPPNKDKSHSISLSNPEGNKGVIFCITIYTNELEVPIYFTKEELETPAHEMYNDIIGLLKANDLI